jgi:two-component system sensor histidine kinase DesK
MSVARPYQPRWFDKENWAAMITWLAFSFIQLRASSYSHGNFSVETICIALSLLWFIVFFLQAQSGEQHRRNYLRLGLMWLTIAINDVLVPNGFTPGLAVLWVALLPWYLPERLVYWSIVPALLPFSVMMLFEKLNPNAILMLITCGTFQFFAIFAMSKARSESLARQALAQTHQQLIDAQSRLSLQAADDERLRISRDLHDSLGHHLTALVIQLQVAEYQAAAAQKPQLAHCHQLAKQLLHEIRHAVSHLRQPMLPNLAEQCRTLASNFPQLALQCSIPTDLALDPVSTALLAKVTQEAVTNSARHGNASKAQVTLWQHGGKIHYRYLDDGMLSTWPIVEGNGLTGMRERIEQASGKLFLSQHELSQQAARIGQVGPALQIDIELPQVDYSHG